MAATNEEGAEAVETEEREPRFFFYKASKQLVFSGLWFSMVSLNFFMNLKITCFINVHTC